MERLKVRVGAVKICIEELQQEQYEYAAELFSKAKENLLNNYPDAIDVKFNIEHYGYDGEFELYLVAYRLETEKEFYARVNIQQMQEAMTRKRELTELARLKAKYEGV